MMRPTLYMIGGPTASGKTAAALELARRVDGVVINADAMQVYRGLPLLTAQPSSEEKDASPHKLFEIFDPSERSSAGRWAELARAEIDAAVRDGKTPILVGGTGLYFAALLGGLADIPPIPDAVRLHATGLYIEKGHDAFRTELAKLDPDSATRIKPNDRQRLIRAYEVVAHTGKTLGQWQKEGEADSIEKDFVVERRLLLPERDALYAACDARFLKMIEAGALEEVRALLDFLRSGDSFMRHCEPSLEGAAIQHATSTMDSVIKAGAGSPFALASFGGTQSPRAASDPRDDGFPNDLPAMKILGVPELAAHLHGELSLDEAIAKAQQATRNFAKRQCTWFRNQWNSD